MKSRDFRVQIILRTVVLLLTVILVGLVFAFIRGKGLVFMPAFLIMVVVLELIWILNLVNRANREITEVFRLIRTGHYDPSLPAGRYSDSFSELFQSLNEVFASIRDVEKHREAYHLFTEILMSLIPVGVILVKPGGNIRLINHSALELLDIPRTDKWTQLLSLVPGLGKPVEKMQAGGTDLARVERKGIALLLSVTVRPVVLLREEYRVITFHDIRNSIGKAEIQAWAGLFRVIRHEILNSVTPIASLAETMQLILGPSGTEKNKPSGLSAKDLDDIRESVDAIRLRTEGLHHFVDLYRGISAIPDPARKPVSLKEFLATVHRLIRPLLEEKGVELVMDESQAEAAASLDQGLMQQVLINLVNNSLVALERCPSPSISIHTEVSGDRVRIGFWDNGKGIPAEQLEDIFIPFFTTRKEGSGLGLSLVKQIITAHGGNISVESVPGEYTRFTIELPLDQPAAS